MAASPKIRRDIYSIIYTGLKKVKKVKNYLKEFTFLLSFYFFTFFYFSLKRGFTFFTFFLLFSYLLGHDLGSGLPEILTSSKIEKNYKYKNLLIATIILLHGYYMIIVQYRPKRTRRFFMIFWPLIWWFSIDFWFDSHFCSWNKLDASKFLMAIP